MNPLVIGLVIAFAIVAVGNWVAVDQAFPDQRRVAVTKTTATVLLIALALVAGDIGGGARVALVVAAVLCLAGDVFLLGSSEVRFLAGLGSFAGGHIAYTVTALLVGVSWPKALIAVPFMVALLGFRFVTRTIPGARVAGGSTLMIAVSAYAVIISAMSITAMGSPVIAAGIGALLFAVSDWFIGYDRFVQTVSHGRLAVMSTYHVGQLLLILGLAAGG